MIAATGPEVREWASELEDHSAGEILILSIERGSSMQGYDLAPTEAVAEAVKTPLIASGSAGTYQHMEQARTQAGAAAGVPVRKPFVAESE